MRRNLPRLAAAIAAALALWPAAGTAQDFMLGQPKGVWTFRVGANLAGAGSEVFDFTRERLTLERSDFHSIFAGGALALPAGDRADVVLDVAYMRSENGSEYRDYVEDNDLPIQQRTKFRQIPLSLSLKGYLAPNGRTVGRYAWIPSSFAPYVGAGVGVMHYDFEQAGDFVDESDETLPIFTDTFRSAGWAPLVNGYGGLDVNLSRTAKLSLEARYTWSRAEMDEDFVDFDRIDLSGVQTSVGVAFRF